jgi:hypothetical protein
MERKKVQVVDYIEFISNKDQKWQWKYKKDDIKVVDELKPDLDPVYPDFSQDEDDVVIEEDNVSGDLTDVKIDRSRYSKINIISKKSFITNLNVIEIKKVKAENKQQTINLIIEKGNSYVKDLESTAPFNTVDLKSKEIINLAID